MIVKVMGTKNQTTTLLESKNEWMSILLIMTTVLFGVGAQITEKLNPIEPSTHEINNSNYIIWLALEIATITLFSSVLYLITSYRSYKRVRANIYRDISLTQMVITNGILIDIIIYYLSQHLVQNTSNILKMDKNMFIVLAFLVFIALPTYVYMGNIRRTIELWIIMFGGYIDQRKEEAPIIASIFLITVLFLVVLTIGTVNASQAFGVLILIMIILFLPYIGVSTKEELELETKLPSRALMYILTSYRVYFIPILASWIIEISTNGNTKKEETIIVVSMILWILSLIELSLRTHPRLKKLKVITAIAIVIEGSILSGMLYYNIYVSLISGLFFVYTMMVTISIGPLLTPYILEKLKLEIQRRYHTK